ncbi:MAG TPA: hypothetical protein VGJ91_14080 [Polyangiaceae bacterium]|jgi:hypothetical protein
MGGAADHACVAVAELACGDGVRVLTTARALPLDSGTHLLADDPREWQDLWRYLGLPDPAPSVDFRVESVVAFIYASVRGAEPDPSLQICRDGRVELTPASYALCTGPLVGMDEPRVVRILAVSRRRLASALQGRAADRAASERVAGEPPGACIPVVDEREILRRRVAFRAMRANRSWFEKLKWQAAAGAIGGVSPTLGGIVGAELRAGLRAERREQFRVGDGEGFFGNLVGLDLRARWLMDPNAARPHLFTVGLWPWMMMREDWVFHRHFTRQPTFMNVLIPEGGLVFNRGLGGYLGWSFPIMLRPTIDFYRQSPYVPSEHWAYELSPGVLWLFEPSGQSVTFTLTFSAGLW